MIRIQGEQCSSSGLQLNRDLVASKAISKSDSNYQREYKDAQIN
jgi:hypothetical protein